MFLLPLNFIPVVILLNGYPVDFKDQRLPYIEQGATLVPARAFVQKAGGALIYDKSTQVTTIYYQGRTLIISDTRKATGDNYRLYVPLRSLAKLMQAKISYNAKYGTASVVTTSSLPPFLQKSPDQRLRETLLEADTVKMGIYDLLVYGERGPTVTETALLDTEINPSELRPIIENIELDKADYRSEVGYPAVLFTFTREKKLLGTLALWVGYGLDRSAFPGEKLGVAYFYGNRDIGLSPHLLSLRTTRELLRFMTKNKQIADVLWPGQPLLPTDPLSSEK